MALAMAARRAGADDQQLAQVTVAYLSDAPEPRPAAVEIWRGVKPRKAANSRPLAKSPMSWIVALVPAAF
jgi:hypothetical protein